MPMRTVQQVLRSAMFTLSVLTWASPAVATTVIEHSFSDLVRQAEVIAVGTVTGIQEHWDASRQVPITQVTFSHLTVLKGDEGPDSLVLEFLGGHLPDGRVLSVIGMPRFTIGEKTVVMSTENRRSFCPLVGMWQGLFRVTVDPHRGEEVVKDHLHRPVAGVHDGLMLKVPPEDTGQPALSLSTFIRLIQQELRNGASKQR